MKYSVNYHSKHIEEADEIRVPWNQMGLVYKLDKRLVITEVERNNTDKSLPEIDKIKDTKDYTISCGDPSLLQDLLGSGYKAFLRYPISDWEMYQSLIARNVTDIYVDGQLGFSMTALFNSKGDTKIRVSPQVSASASLFSDYIEGSGPNTFYIRPEDLRLYEHYIDVIDFKETNQEKEDTLFTIYKRGNWTGDLKDLIPSVAQSVQNPYLKPEFAEARLNCGQICKIPGRVCHLCLTQFALTNLVVDYFSNKDKT